MSQTTLVLQVPPGQQAALRASLGRGSFEFRTVPHALFSAKGEGVVITLYESGKFVVQGADPEFFLARFTDLEAPTSAPARDKREAAEASDSVSALDVVTVGSDETGKGDYFGPLVVAAVRVEPEQVAALEELGVADSKKLTDTRALRLGAALRASMPFALKRLDPPAYNAAYAKYQNLNPMLAELHAAAIAELAEPGMRVVVDQFGGEKLMRTATAGLAIKLEQAPRAERNVAVAAASIIARQEFLACLLELSQEYGVELHKGAGAPVDAAGVRYVQQHGEAALAQVAKLHFKTTLKIQDRLS